VTVDVVIIHCDGGSRGNPGPAAIGAVVRDGTVDPPVVLATVSECIGVATNNVAEYRALIAGLDAAREYQPRRVVVRADSELLVRQLEGRYKVKSEHLRPLFEEAKAQLAEYDEVDLGHVRREQNVDADALVNAALDAAEC
jgi:ribonuclease HI